MQLEEFSKLILSCLLLTAPCLASSTPLTHIRPTPELPKVKDIALTEDIFSYSMHRQIQCTLFQMTLQSSPKAHLIESFHVSKNQLEYHFKIKPGLFLHDQQPIQSSMIKASLEASIDKKAINFEGFRNISKIDIIDEHQFSLRLVRPDPNLIHKLTDLRFSIRSLKDPLVGCGQYKVVKKDKSQWVLELHNKDKGTQSNRLKPHRIIYKKTTYAEALEGFEKGTYDDLALFAVNGKDRARIAELGNVSQVIFPRTYMLALNSKNLTKIQRSFIFSKIHRRKIISDCYPSQKITNSLVPPGFLGFSENALVASKPVAAELTKFDIAGVKSNVVLVAIGVAEDQCVVGHLKSFLEPLGLVVKLGPVSVLTQKWDKGDLAGVFAYTEGESTFHYFGSFSPEINLSYGEHLDKKFSSLFKAYTDATTAESMNKSAQILSRHILSQKTVIPFFHEIGFFAYNRRYKHLGQIFTSPALMSISEFRMKDAQ